MRLSKFFSKTLRQEPAEAETVSHRLMLKAGMIHQVAAGSYCYLPLAWRTLRKIEQIIREEMDAAGGQELMLPALHPLEMWEESGRAVAFGQTLFTFTDRRERRLCLAPTHEEVITELVRKNVQSYRDLPMLVYQIQTKFRDEPRPRGGLLRVREFDMKDLYSLDTDQEALDVSYRKMLQAYKNIFDRCGMPTVLLEAESGAIGGKDSHEYMMLAETGENEAIQCSRCDYAANVEKATSVKPKMDREAPLPLEEVSTPGVKTIAELASSLNIPESRTLKAVFYSADGELVFAVIRGDLEVNETKLKSVLDCADLRLADEQEVQAAGIVAGSASPVGLSGIKVVADDSVPPMSNFAVGGNKPDTHLRNANYPRDFKADLVTDIATARAGDQCPRCGGELLSILGIEIGHLFKLGTTFSDKLGAYYLDREGNQKPVVMGSYGIGTGRLLAAAIERHHDEKGIIWPLSIAPYQVYLCLLDMENPKVVSAAEKLYVELKEKGIEVLYDDRAESAGVKFNDADLLGMPLRLTVSPRTLKKDSAEVKKRASKEEELVALEEVTGKVKALLTQMASN